MVKIDEIISNAPIKVEYDPTVIKKLSQILIDVSKMGQIEYADFMWEDKIKEIIDEAEK